MKTRYVKLATIIAEELVKGTIEWGAIQMIARTLWNDKEIYVKLATIDKVGKKSIEYESVVKRITEVYKPIEKDNIYKRPKYYVYCRECGCSVDLDDIEELKKQLSQEGWKINTITKDIYCKTCYESLVACEIKKERRWKIMLKIGNRVKVIVDYPKNKKLNGVYGGTVTKIGRYSG